MTGLQNANGRVRILYDNRVARRGTTISASSAATPPARVGQPRPARKWRATGNVREVLWIDFGEPVSATHGALIGHNLDAGGEIRWTLTNDPAAETDPDAAELVFDTTVRPWGPIHGFGFDPFGESLGGFPASRGFAAFPARRVLDYERTVVARYLRIELDNPRLDAPVAAGVVVHGTGFTPHWNQAFGWQVAWRDPTEQIETEAGRVPAPAGEPVRVLTFALDTLRQPEAFKADDINRVAGKRRPVLVELFADGAKPLATRTAVYGYLREADPVSQGDPLAFQAGWDVEELPD